MTECHSAELIAGGQNGAVPQKNCFSCTSQVDERNTFSNCLAGKDSVLTRLAGRNSISTCLAGEKQYFDQHGWVKTVDLIHMSRRNLKNVMITTKYQNLSSSRQARALYRE